MISYKRSLLASCLSLALVATVWSGCADAITETDQFVEIPVNEALIEEMSEKVLVKTGNGAPSGPHYNLNFIGVPKDKTASMDGNNGHRIFVKLYGNTKIYLGEGDDFAVLDANGTDGNGARFQLPNPDPDNVGVTVYSVYARALGKPGGSGTITPCAMSAGEDGILGTDDDVEVCSMTALVLERGKGKSGFQNVSKYLLYVNVDLDGDGQTERYNLFNDDLEDYLWDYDNRGLKLVQLRFYPESTDTN